MSGHLKELIEKARKHKITDAERAAQIRSFAYGNTHFENKAITKEHIEREMNALRTERESTLRS